MNRKRKQYTVNTDYSCRQAVRLACTEIGSGIKRRTGITSPVTSGPVSSVANHSFIVSTSTDILIGNIRINHYRLACF